MIAGYCRVSALNAVPCTAFFFVRQAWRVAP